MWKLYWVYSTGRNRRGKTSRSLYGRRGGSQICWLPARKSTRVNGKPTRTWYKSTRSLHEKGIGGLGGRTGLQDQPGDKRRDDTHEHLPEWRRTRYCLFSFNRDFFSVSITLVCTSGSVTCIDSTGFSYLAEAALSSDGGRSMGTGRSTGKLQHVHVSVRDVGAFSW